jgi:division protein CdvB (Snf7/Vps24/ESCRT-III family)
MMDINTALGLGANERKESSEVEVGRNIRELARDQVERGDPKVSPENLAALVSQLSDASIREIDALISQLQRLRTQLKNAGVRIQGDIVGYAKLSQQTMQLTSIIVDGVRKLAPGAPR